MAPLPPAPAEIDAPSAARLRKAAAEAGYDERLLGILGIVGAAGWKEGVRAAVPRMPTPACGVLARFFLTGETVPRPELGSALGGSEVPEALDRCGIAERSGDGRRCRFVLVPAPGALILSDAIDDPASESPPDDYIMPVSGSSRFVDDLAVREPCELAVDLGCGQGYHALRALTHARRCIATDINARAMEFARANAALNAGADRIECRLGSFFEPLADVAGNVDLLTCNPPFIIHPGGHTTAAVSPTEGDGMLEHLVRTAPSMLRSGGWATMIGIWEQAALPDWTSRPLSWLDGAGCDALLLQFRTYRPEEYIPQWFAPEARAAAEAGWRVICERRAIGAVTFGGIVIRKRPGPNWSRALYTLINARTGPASEQLRAFFATQTRLQSASEPAALLERRLRVAAGWRFDPAQPPARPAPAGARPGLPFPLQNAAQMEPMLQSFDGNTTARQTLDFLHQWNRVPMPATHPAIPGMLQSLVSTGCLDIVD